MEGRGHPQNPSLSTRHRSTRLLSRPPEACPDAIDAAPEKLPVGEVQELENHGREHEVCASYDHTPPASGDHFPAWQNCGIYTQPIQNQTASAFP